MHKLQTKCHFKHHIKSTTTERDDGLFETEFRSFIRNEKWITLILHHWWHAVQVQPWFIFPLFFRNAFKRLTIICPVEDWTSEKVAEPAGAGLAADSSVCPSAHTDFDPGKRESLANIQRLPCTQLPSTVLLLGTPRQRDRAARGPWHTVTLQQLSTVQSPHSQNTAACEGHKHDKMFCSAVCYVCNWPVLSSRCARLYPICCTGHMYDLLSVPSTAQYKYPCSRCMSQLVVSPVTEDSPFGPWGSDGQLEGRVEVVLLLVWAVDHLPSPDHQKAWVSQVGCVQPVTLPVQNHNAGRAATCRHTQTRTYISFSISVQMLCEGLHYPKNKMVWIIRWMQQLQHRSFMTKLKSTVRSEFLRHILCCFKIRMC